MMILMIMSRLTRREQLVLCTVLFLLLTGLATKAWRDSHPPMARSAGLTASH